MTMRSDVRHSRTGATAALRVDGERLWRSLMDLALIGATPKGGVRRLALTALDGQGRDLVVGWLRATGASIEIDGAGNIFATRRGRDDAAPPVLTGSHVDTQPSGGKFDGNYGVLAGLEVLRTLEDAGIVTERPVAVAIWTNEEGSRFVPVMGGSGAFAGVYTLEHVRQLSATSTALRSAMRSPHRLRRRCGGRWTRARRLFRGAHRAGTYSRARGKDRGRGHRSAGALAGTTASGPDRTRTPVRHRWRRAATLCAARRAWSRRSMRWRCVMRPTAGRRSGSCRSARIRATSSQDASK